MPITVLNDVIVPNSIISAGVSGKQMRRNTRAMAANGQMQINVGWSKTLRQFQLGIVPMRVDQWQALEGLFEVTDAGAYGMLLLDPKDSACAAADGKVTLVGAVFYLYKRYTSAGSTRYRDRKITRPQSAIVVYRNAVAMSSGYTVDYTTGIVTITTPNTDVFTWSGNFYVPVHFASDQIDWDLVISGQASARFLAGPSVTLNEVRE